MRTTFELAPGANTRRSLSAAIAAMVILIASSPAPASAQSKAFRIEEATIPEIHSAIQDGSTTCRGIVQAYIDRAKAYNGICTKLVTKDGAKVSPGRGAVRAGAPVKFPSETVAVSSILPDFEQYRGLPIEVGRMEATQSDPAAQQQFGMLVGAPGARQVNALSTLNLRGERSVSCAAKCDAHPSTGSLPAACPVACDDFRKQPDALEWAAELDARYGSNPDLKNLPMYCVAFSFKDALDAKDMRSTMGADIRYAKDFAPADSTVVARLRAHGAIIYAKANLAENNGAGGSPGSAVVTSRIYGDTARSTWAGAACNPYDTSRETGGSSSGSAASVGANLVSCSICEETGGSCRQPAWRNGIVGFVTTKGLMSYAGAVGSQPYFDRPGVHCRTVGDAALVLDALKDPQTGYFDPRDVYTALPKSMVSEKPYASFVFDQGGKPGKPLAGMRIGIVREYMVKHSANDAAMSDQVNEEIKRVLRDRLGAQIVESFDPLYPDDPTIPNMAYNFQQAMAEIIPFHMPEHFQAKGRDGKLRFAVPGHDVTTWQYLVKAATGEAPLSAALNMRSVNTLMRSESFGFDTARYLHQRGDARVKDFGTLNANMKHYAQARSVQMKNWENGLAVNATAMSQHMKMRDVMRLVLAKVMLQNGLDVLVNPTTTVPPARIGYATQPTVNDRPLGRFPTTSNLGIPEITVPAGFNKVIYEPAFVLNATKDGYESAANDSTQSLLDAALPIGISFWAGPGEEAVILKTAAAYEAATKHRAPPPDFGPVDKR